MERGEILETATREQPKGLFNEHVLRAHDAGEEDMRFLSNEPRKTDWKGMNSERS
jgi:hypothetical protein